jgi:hypothetical protein
VSTGVAIVTALEALEVGDQELAVSVLLNALEDSPRRERCACSDCGQGFEWPGQRDAHIAAVHGFEEAA